MVMADEKKMVGLPEEVAMTVKGGGKEVGSKQLVCPQATIYVIESGCFCEGQSEVVG